MKWTYQVCFKELLLDAKHITDGRESVLLAQSAELRHDVDATGLIAWAWQINHSHQATIAVNQTLPYIYCASCYLASYKLVI